MLSTFADCALDFEQVDFVSFLRDSENNLETAKLYFRNGREIYLDKSSTDALAEALEVSSTSDETSTMATISDNRT